MDGNNKKERITLEEARNITRQVIQKIVSKEFPLVYISDSYEEYQGNYLIHACPYNSDENPEDHCIRVFVDGITGKPSLAFDLTG